MNSSSSSMVGLPKPHKKVLAVMENELGVSKLIMAEYVPEWSHETDVEPFEEDDDAFDYDESSDIYYLRPGWYEVTECYDMFTYIPVDGTIIDWYPAYEAVSYFKNSPDRIS